MYQLQTSTVAQSYFLILSYTRKSNLIVSEVQMILVSHSLWNLSFYHGPFPLSPLILVPISVCLPPLVQFYFFPSPTCGFLLPYLIFSLNLTYLISHVIIFLPVFIPLWCYPHPPSPLFNHFLLNYILNSSELVHRDGAPYVAAIPPAPDVVVDLTLFPPSLQVMWTQVKARWWVTCFTFWAMSTNAPYISMSRSRRKREKLPLSMLGFWMKLARRGTGTFWCWSTDWKICMYRKYVCFLLYTKGCIQVWFQMDKNTFAMQMLLKLPVMLNK